MRSSLSLSLSLSLYPDSGHGALFQHSASFVEQVARFLDGLAHG